MLKRICKRVKRTGSPLVQTFLYFFSLNKAQSYIVLLFYASVLVYLSNSLQVLKGAYLPLRVHSQS